MAPSVLTNACSNCTAGGTAAYQVADASKDSDVAAVIQLALHKYGRLDIFVANAAVFREKRLDELSINVSTGCG